jgi:hypothetical protein
LSLTERNVHGALSAYKSICDEKRFKPKQTTTGIFLKRVTTPQEEFQAGPAGRIPQEGIVIIDMTASCKLLPLKTPQ